MSKSLFVRSQWPVKVFSDLGDDTIMGKNIFCLYFTLIHKWPLTLVSCIFLSFILFLLVFETKCPSGIQLSGLGNGKPIHRVIILSLDDVTIQNTMKQWDQLKLENTSQSDFLNDIIKRNLSIQC